VDQEDQVYWLAVIARALASFSLQTPELRNQSITEKTKFLVGLGLQYKDVADMLGSSEASVRELVRISKNLKAKKKNAKKTKR
jgi:hypothetical protein